MSIAVAEFVSAQQGDSYEFIAKARAITLGVALDYEPARLYVIRIDNWFGPRWMHFAGKVLGLVGVHPIRPLHVPPFVPHRVMAERVFAGPDFETTVPMPQLHVQCPGSRALHRRIADIDEHAAFVWFSGQSEAQGRGSTMVYLPVASAQTGRQDGLRGTGAFYVGFSQARTIWHPTMLRGVSRGEVEHLEETGRALSGLPG